MNAQFIVQNVQFDNKKDLYMTRMTLFMTCIFITSWNFAQTNAFEVKISGKGQPMLLLPGFTCPGEVWNDPISKLNDEYKTYQLTYAGFAQVTAIKLPWYSTLVNEIITYMKVNDLKNTIIIGHSMGGMLAIDIAAQQPERISKIILVDALPCIREIVTPQLTADQITFDNPYTQQMIEASDSALSITAGYMAQGMSNNTAKQDQIMRWIMEADRETYVYGYVELLKLDLRDQLTSITTPTLILGAGFPSKEAAIGNFESQYENLPSKTIKIATDSKHFIMFDQPDWLMNEINQFLK